MTKPGQPVAIKRRGAELYDPGVSTAFGSKALPHGSPQETRYKAIKEAKRLIEEAGGA